MDPPRGGGLALAPPGLVGRSVPEHLEQHELRVPGSDQAEHEPWEIEGDGPRADQEDVDDEEREDRPRSGEAEPEPVAPGKARVGDRPRALLPFDPREEAAPF